jgi:anti-sigma factor RsiW
MMCGNAKEWMAAAWSGELDEAAEAQLKRHLAGCPECGAEMAELSALWERLGDLPAPEPSLAQHVRWQAALESLARTESTPHHSTAWGSNAWKFSLNALWPRRPVWQATIAASCLIAGLLIGGFWQGVFGEHHRREDAQIATLRSEVEATRELAALSLLRQQSATERLRGVDYSQRMPTLEPRVVSALIEAVNHDSNVNVRLAAIDALAKAADDAQVRQSMRASLGRQESPMVQAALIDYLVDSRDAAAAPALREFSGRADLNEAVKQHAEVAARQLTEYR